MVDEGGAFDLGFRQSVHGERESYAAGGRERPWK